MLFFCLLRVDSARTAPLDYLFFTGADEVGFRQMTVRGDAWQKSRPLNPTNPD